MAKHSVHLFSVVGKQQHVSEEWRALWFVTALSLTVAPPPTHPKPPQAVPHLIRQLILRHRQRLWLDVGITPGVQGSPSIHTVFRSITSLACVLINWLWVRIECAHTGTSGFLFLPTHTDWGICCWTPVESRRFPHSNWHVCLPGESDITCLCVCVCVCVCA